jgi:aryl-alcohol dehydrogenase-like predicted oxidoreductase
MNLAILPLAITMMAGPKIMSAIICQIQSSDDFEEDDFRRTSPRFQGETFRKNLELVERVKEITAEKGVMPGQVALAWLLHQGEDIVSIPGTKRSKYLEENAAAVDVTLTEEDHTCIDEVAPKGVAPGERYNEAFMRTANR